MMTSEENPLSSAAGVHANDAVPVAIVTEKPQTEWVYVLRKTAFILGFATIVFGARNSIKW